MTIYEILFVPFLKIDITAFAASEPLLDLFELFFKSFGSKIAIIPKDKFKPWIYLP